MTDSFRLPVDMEAFIRDQLSSGIGATASGNFVRRDGTTTLTADWDIGNGRRIDAEKIQARDADGLSLFEDGGTGIFVEDSTGHTGLLTANPIAALHVEINGGGLSAIFGDDTAGQNDSIFIAGNQIGGAYSRDADDFGMWLNLKGYQNGNTRFRDLNIGDGKGVETILKVKGSTGFVGIQTTTPDRVLEIVDSTGPHIRMTQSDAVEFVEFTCDSSSQFIMNNDGNDTLKVTQVGVLSVDLSGSGSAAQVDLFDDYDDPVEIEQLLKWQNLNKMCELGVISPKKTGSSYWMHLQPMVRLLGGGIYQLYHEMKRNYSELSAEIAELKARIG